MSRFAAPFALTAATALLLTACGGGGNSVSVSAPHTTGAVARQCAALQKALPETLMGLSRRDTSPSSQNTAAWGDPAVTWRCGTGLPGVMDPHSKDYTPFSDNVTGQAAGGVCWASIYNQSDKSFTFASVDQQAIVQLSIPADYTGKQSPLSVLAPAVAKTSPLDPDRKFQCTDG
ncbi:DUF3515 domain-containing protein [Streptacidiphilus pinicola]|uniref:DUF3515 domain-containing protein n=1 Tax=Streptacidiphilus pinicola TaxID=2219663 RepID=A0A2X0J5W6_9ACTN|nr:DUF3515 domain-containing protein [Streptacidiphilus pinicola]RAG82788.1 DUF3515 domain-containing protein [Streptacidiphilus pinicola]